MPLFQINKILVFWAALQAMMSNDKAPQIWGQIQQITNAFKCAHKLSQV